VIDHAEQQRRLYAHMSDEELRRVQRENLADMPRKFYDQEISRRGLRPEPVSPSRPDGLVVVASFQYDGEARLARALLESASIPAYIENQHTIVAYGLGELHLMVPAPLAEEARAVLDSRVSDQDLAAQAEASPNHPAKSAVD
jgi:hypothetical protein